MSLHISGIRVKTAVNLAMAELINDEYHNNIQITAKFLVVTGSGGDEYLTQYGSGTCCYRNAGMVKPDQWRSTKRAIIGGVTGNNTAEWLYNDIFDGDLLELCIHAVDCHTCNIDPTECGYNQNYMASDGTVLIGFKATDDKDKAWFWHESVQGIVGFMPDDSREYSAIVGELYTQVIHSRWFQMAEMCSPCYPGQGNLDAPGGFATYALPPDRYGGDDNTPEIFKID